MQRHWTGRAGARPLYRPVDPYGWGSREDRYPRLRLTNINDVQAGKPSRDARLDSPILAGVGDPEIEGRELAAVELNAAIWRAAVRLDAAEEESEWEFKSECGAPDCEATASITLAEFDRLHAAGQLILAEGHTVTRAERARRRAKTAA